MSDKETKDEESKGQVDAGQVEGLEEDGSEKQPNLTRSYFVVAAGILTIFALFMAFTFSKVAPKGDGIEENVWSNIVKFLELLFKML